MGNDEIATKSRDMFNDIMTIDSHFKDAGYKGDTVILGIKELAEFIRFYQPAAQPWQPIETAPRDGKTEFMVWMNFGKVYGGVKWREDKEWPENHYGFLPEATHWMPLPAAPKKED